MAEAVHIARTENEACTELEGVFAKFVLAMTGGIGPFARDSVVPTHQVKKVRALQFGGAICSAVSVNQKRKCDASLFAEYARIVKIAHADRR